MKSRIQPKLSVAISKELPGRDSTVHNDHGDLSQLGQVVTGQQVYSSQACVGRAICRNAAHRKDAYLNYEPIDSLPGRIEYGRGHKGRPEACTAVTLTTTSDWVEQPYVSYGCWWRKVSVSKQG